MKKLLLIFTLVLGSMAFTAPNPAAAQQPLEVAQVSPPAAVVDTAQVAPINGMLLSSGIDVRSLSDAELRMALYTLDTALVALQARVTENYNHQHEHDSEIHNRLVSQDRNRFPYEMLDIIRMTITLGIILAAIVVTLFFVMKYKYRIRHDRYELEKAKLEKIDYCNPTALEKVVPPYSRSEKAAHFYLRAMITLFISFIIALFFATVMAANVYKFMDFIATVILMVVSASLGMGIVYLFKEYTKRINADGQQ